MIDTYSVHAFHLKDEGLTLMFSTVSIVSGHFKTAQIVRWTSCIGLLEYWSTSLHYFPPHAQLQNNL